MALADQCWNMNSPVRALTVTAIGLIPAEELGEQLDLFDSGADRRARLERLDLAMDAIRAKYGRKAILPASVPGHTLKRADIQ